LKSTPPPFLPYVDLGNRTFAQRPLRLGRRGDNLVEILSGLDEGDQVVTTGALLVDAQAQLAREASAHSPTPANTEGPPSPAGKTPVRNEAAAPSIPTVVDVSADPLASLAAVAVEAVDALATDDYARYQKIFSAMAGTAKTFPALPALELGTDLKTARRSFEPWSTAVADLLKPHRAHLGLKIFQCPMSPVSHTGRWVQRSEPLKNPFFGSTMADCGEEVR
jgi:Cu(I)/Ag(I) efflux system membrane fusion protein